MQITWNLEHSYQKLPKALFSSVNPVPVKSPQLALFNEGLSKELGLNFEELDADSLSAIFSGNQLPKDAQPLAQAYAGHQFGQFTMLGDGRAVLLGEQITPSGKRYDIQFKGSGRTPYSRGGDGRAHLGAMLREYLISEAMYYLNIPTTRALAVVLTGEPVYREKVKQGAILTRVGQSHLRVGTFEYARNFHDGQHLKDLLQYSIARHFPEVHESKNPALPFFEAVMSKQIELITQWMRVGFIHGVMNTDNMSIPGETIDYGPCAFMNTYDPKTVFSSIDTQGRYAYGNQPFIAHWNLGCLASTLLPEISSDTEEAIKLAKESINKFPKAYEAKWLQMMGRKLGMDEVKTTDKALIDDLLHWMKVHKADFTNTFLYLRRGVFPKDNLYDNEDFKAWLVLWKERISGNMQRAQELMDANNPAFIPRNHLVEEALEAASADGNMQPFQELLAVLSQPYKDVTGMEKYQEVPLGVDIEYQTFCGT
ncbi:MAG: YdiU family protein [Mongoliibacter sp.]|uniref:protein adenylyltransferase SelO n=1 Tax=Mongoliibacter sp. TaxID=2022438 RepID=UPI0012F375C3|nr:YdiU family protein [Mongoliibacter sp.]TVP54490.1 MAG: YdiU family protein [Mongoliibacter sp.]